MNNALSQFVRDVSKAFGTSLAAAPVWRQFEGPQQRISALSQSVKSVTWFAIIAGIWTGFVHHVEGDVLLPEISVSVIEDFDNYRGDGFAPTPSSGQLDSDTYRPIGFSDGDGAFGGTYTTGDFARGQSTGGVTTGGTYAFEVGASDFALGIQPTTVDFTPGNLTIRISNQTGQSISRFRIEADVYLFDDQDRSSQWTFAVSVDDSTYVDIFQLESGEAADKNPVWLATPFTGTIPFVSPLSDGSQFFIRITGKDLAGSGSRDEFALDNLVLTAVPLSGDVNLDGIVSLDDVAPFVALLVSEDFQAEADINDDGVVNLLDVAPFVAILLGG